jgi:hypothetical protein
MENTMKLAFILSEESSEAIRRNCPLVIQADWTPLCSHMDITDNEDDIGEATTELETEGYVNVECYDYIWDSDIIVALCRFNSHSKRPDGSMFHVVIAINKGVEPWHAHELIDRAVMSGWSFMSRDISITGTVSVI